MNINYEIEYMNKDNKIIRLKTKNIDAIQFDLSGINGYTIKYRTSIINNAGYLPWVYGYNTYNSDGYAGIFGKAIDKIQIEIIKNN